jgi:hypothetical protein
MVNGQWSMKTLPSTENQLLIQIADIPATNNKGCIKIV